MLGEAVAMYWGKDRAQVKRLPEDFTTLRPRMFARKLKNAGFFGQVGNEPSWPHRQRKKQESVFTDAEHPLIR